MKICLKSQYKTAQLELRAGCFFIFGIDKGVKLVKEGGSMKKIVSIVALLTIAVALSFSSAYAVSKDSAGASRDLARVELSPREPCRTCVKKAPGVCNNRFTFDATDSYDPNDLKLSFLWNLGDGTTSTEPVVTHSYAKGGTYTVTLTVTNTSGLKCDTSVSTRTVTVNTPPAAVLKGPKSGCANTALTFDASGSMDNTPENLTYAWDFGDGTKAKGKTVSKKYAKGGIYYVALTVDDNANTPCSVDTAKQTIKINNPPVAEAGQDVSMCVAPGQAYKINFDGSGSSDADRDTLTYRWDFGDGQTGEGKRVSHTYTKGGSYTVKLMADDGSGSACAFDVDRVNVNLSKPPIARAGDDMAVCTGTSVILDGSGSSSEEGKLSYSWDLGDGTTTKGPKVKHTYTKGGVYTAILTVDNGRGTKCAVANDAVRVIVNSQPLAAIKGSGQICTGQNVKFDASGSKDPDGDSLVYMWDFGDGKVEKGSSRSAHTYTKGGNYTVTVSVNDGRNTPCSRDAASMRVKVNTPPVADAGPNLVCCLGTENVFDGSASYDPDGDSLTYSWDFGDGSGSKEAKTTHEYKKNGTYKITLTVDDGSGTVCSRSVDSFTASVKERPVSVIKVR